MSKAKAATYVNSGALLLGTGELSSSNDPGGCRPSSHEAVWYRTIACGSCGSRRAQVHSIGRHWMDIMGPGEARGFYYL